MASRSIKTSNSANSEKVLNINTLNPHIREMEYAVRGAIVTRAGEIEQEIKDGQAKPFTSVIKANIGDCHAMGQKPITFLRQVQALVSYPDLLESPQFPADAKDRAQRILNSCKGNSIGSYTDSPGLEVVRKDVAAYITDRDEGIPCDFKNIYLSNGASDSIKFIMKLLMKPYSESRAGVMIPIPQYPLYTATIAEYDAAQIPYYLNEDKGWGLDISELERALDEAREHCDPRAIVIINPGNPTGQVLDEENILEIIRFAKKNHLFILADEVYQHNVYAAGKKFHSFKKVAMTEGDDLKDVELASFMSTSKGFMGECGARGGYVEVINMDPEVKVQLEKFISAKLCSTVSGQAVMDASINTPKENEPSYETFTQEKNKVLGDLKKKAQMVKETLSTFEGFTLNETMGAMYSFPRVHLPEKAIQAAEAAGQKPDFFYCHQMLENTGICVVPGSGFGQYPGTYHFRMTILPTVDLLGEMLQRMKSFHEDFMNKYR